MTDTLLQSLRTHMLDESEPLAGLLRKCLLLGAETGSASLRTWARLELNGYGPEDEVPAYRRIAELAISMDSQSGSRWVTGQIVTVLDLPKEARELLQEGVPFPQPVEELERLAQDESLSFTHPALAYAMFLWNKQLGPFQQIVGMKHILPGAVLAGMVGQIRTKLVDIVADLTAETPLTELPAKARVDAVVDARVGTARDVYNTTITQAQGPVAIGAGANANQGASVDELQQLLTAVRQAADGVEAGQRAELDAALGDLHDALDEDDPDTGEVMKRTGKLRAVAEKLGIAAVTTATTSAAAAITDAAMNGAFT